MKKLNYLTIGILIWVLGVSVSGASLNAGEILAKMDDHRLISSNFEMMIRVDSFLKNHMKGSALMNGTVKNGQMTSLTFLEPSSMKGRKAFIKDNDMWLVIPNVKNPIRITPSQRLVGGISYGDIAAIGYTEGYAPKLNGEETINRMDSEGNKSVPDKCLILELTAKETGSSYNRIMIWVDKQNFLPVKADFFALSGKKMTTVYYTAPKELNGKMIITKMFLFDQINKTKHFSMEYTDIKMN